MKRSWPIWLLALLPLIPLWRAVFLGETIGAFDEIRPMAPWNGQATSQPWDVLQADSVLQFYAWRDLVLQSWGRGELPLWNAYQLCGTPLLANSQSGGLYPPHILLGLLHVPTGLALTLLAWFHLFWAGLGTFRLSRKLGANEVGSVVAGASFALSQFMLAWTDLPSVISTCAWIPWLLLGVENTCSPESDDRRWLHGVGLAVAMAMMLLAGHLQFAAYGFLAAAILAIWRLTGLALASRREGKRASFGRTLAVGLAAGALGIVLALPHLAAVLGLSKDSHRQSTATEEGYQAYAAGGIPAITLVGITNPGLQGLPTQPAPEVEGASNYWPGFVHRGANFAESALGLTPLVVFFLVVGAFGIRRWKGLGAYGALTIGALLLALGTPLNRILYFGLPGWSATGSPGRIAVLFVLGCCVLAGKAVPDAETSKRSSALTAAVFVLIGITPFLMLRSVADSATSWLPQIGHDIIGKLVNGAAGAATGPYFVALLLCLVVALMLPVAHKFKAAFVVVVACLLPISLYATQVVRTGSPLARLDPPAGGERIAAINDSWDLLTAAPALLPPNTASLSRIHDLSGYDSLLHRDTVKLLHDIMGQDPAPPANGNMMFVKTSANPLTMAEAGVSEVWSRRPIEKLGILAVEDGGLYKYRLAGPGRAFVTDSGGEQHPARISDETTTGFRVQATGPGKLTIRDRAMAGWFATVASKDVAVPEALWMAVELPAGDQTITFRYRPPGVHLAIWMALLGWLGCGLVAWKFIRMSRSET